MKNNILKKDNTVFEQLSNPQNYQSLSKQSEISPWGNDDFIHQTQENQKKSRSLPQKSSKSTHYNFSTSLSKYRKINNNLESQFQNTFFQKAQKKLLSLTPYYYPILANQVAKKQSKNLTQPQTNYNSSIKHRFLLNNPNRQTKKNVFQTYSQVGSRKQQKLTIYGLNYSCTPSKNGTTSSINTFSFEKNSKENKNKLEKEILQNFLQLMNEKQKNQL